MAKNDFQVITYQILNYLYQCLKNDETPDVNKLTAKYFDINDRYFCTILYELKKHDYIDGVTEVNVCGCSYTQMAVTEGVSITLDGVDYLTDNSFIEKVKSVLKDVKDIIPGL